MARLAAKEDPISYTILINLDLNWHQHTNPYYTTYLDTYNIAYIPPNTLQYQEPIIPPFDKNSYIKTQAIQILCIYHMTSTIGDISTLPRLYDYTVNTTILIQVAQPTPPHTNIQNDKLWHILPAPTFPIHTNTHITPFPNYTFALPLKFPPKYCYYTNESFYLSKQFTVNTWQPKTAPYGVYGPIKDLQILEGLLGFQNILKEKLMAIYTFIKLNITTYTKEQIYIFTNGLDSIYLINTQMRYPSAHNNHPNKTILSQIVEMLQSQTQPICGRDKVHTKSHKYAHFTPYYLHKDEWIGMHYTPYKGTIRNFQSYFKKTYYHHTPH